MDPRTRVLCPACNVALTAEEQPGERLVIKRCPRCGDSFPFHTAGWLSEDPDVVCLLDAIVREYREFSGSMYTEACVLVEDYYRKFTDQEFCKTIGVPTQDDDFFFHESAYGMALRIHYYLVLKAAPDPWRFIEWRSTLGRSSLG